MSKMVRLTATVNGQKLVRVNRSDERISLIHHGAIVSGYPRALLKPGDTVLSGWPRGTSYKQFVRSGGIAKIIPIVKVEHQP